MRGDRKAIDRVTGETFVIRQSTTYKEWEEMLLERNGEKELLLARKKVKNYKADLKSYKNLADETKKEFNIKSLDDYQNLKYKNQEEFKRLKAYKR